MYISDVYLIEYIKTRTKCHCFWMAIFVPNESFAGKAYHFHEFIINHMYKGLQWCKLAWTCDTRIIVGTCLFINWMETQYNFVGTYKSEFDESKNRYERNTNFMLIGYNGSKSIYQILMMPARFKNIFYIPPLSIIRTIYNIKRFFMNIWIR